MNWIANNVAELLTAISILFAVLTWYIAHRNQARKDKIHYTLEVLGQTKTLEHLGRADFLINQAISKNITIDPSQVSPELEPAIFLMLNYYEDLCAWHAEGVIDGPMLKHLRGGLIKKTFDLCKPYIDDYRAKQGRDEIYLKLEQFTKTLSP